MHWPALITEQDVTALCVAQCEATHVRVDLGKQPLHSSKRHILRNRMQSHRNSISYVLRPKHGLPCPRDHSGDPMAASRSAVSTSLLRYFFGSSKRRSSTALHQCTNGMSWQFASAVSRVVLPSCTTHAAAESVEQAAMLQVRGGMSEVITSHIVTDR